MQKSFQINRRSQRSSRLALLTLALLLVVLVLGKTILFVASLQKPFNVSTQKKYSWDGRSSINLVFMYLKSVQDPEISVISIHPKDQKATILSISNQTYMELPKSMGFWQLGSIYKLGQEENPPNGAALLELSLSKLLGLPIDGVIIQNGSASGSSRNLVTNLHQNPLSAALFWSNLKSDLKLPEVFNVYGQLSAIRGDKITYLDLERSDITESKLLQDSSRVLGVDSVKMDLYIRQNLADSGITQESKSIAVFNATNHPGIAAEAARIITNMGGNVIILTSTDNIQKESGIYVDSKDGKGITFNRLAQIFAPNCITNKCVSADPKVVNSRAQISVVLGEDYYKTWYER